MSSNLMHWMHHGRAWQTVAIPLGRPLVAIVSPRAPAARFRIALSGSPPSASPLRSTTMNKTTQVLCTAVLVTTAFATVGCTTTMRANEIKSPAPPGQIYYLPRAEFGVDVERELVRCDSDGNVHSVEIELRAEARPRLVADLQLAYSIDYPAMRRSTKRTEYEVQTYPNGTLKSINAGIEDQTAQVIGQTLVGVARLAAVFGGFPLAFAARASEAERMLTPLQPDRPGARMRHEPLCTSNTLSLLEARSVAEQQAAAARSELQVQRRAVDEARSAAVSAEHALAEARRDALPKVEIDRLAAAVVAAHARHLAADQRVRSGERELATIEKRRASARQQLTMHSHTHFRPTRSLRQLPLQGDAAATAWFDAAVLDRACARDLRCEDGVPAEVTGWVAVHVIDATRTDEKPEEGAEGVLYRQPAEGLMLVCAGTRCIDDASGDIVASRDARALVDTVALPQFGIVGVLPLRNRAFQNNLLEASFTEAGALTRVKYSSNARAVAQAETLAASAQTLLDYQAARREHENQSLQRDLDRTHARRELADAHLQQARAEQALRDFLERPKDPL